MQDDQTNPLGNQPQDNNSPIPDLYDANGVPRLLTDEEVALLKQHEQSSPLATNQNPDDGGALQIDHPVTDTGVDTHEQIDEGLTDAAVDNPAGTLQISRDEEPAPAEAVNQVPTQPPVAPDVPPTPAAEPTPQPEIDHPALDQFQPPQPQVFEPTLPPVQPQQQDDSQLPPPPPSQPI